MPARGELRETSIIDREFILLSQRQSEFRTWHVPGLTPEVVYSTTVMRRLALLAEEGYRKSPMGGEEVGGVLFGVIDEDEVRVTAARALECEHARGPGFSLSASDEQRLRDLVASPATDPDLRDLTPVGWYLSRTRSGIGLSEDDVKLFNQFFPLTGQLTLVLRPEPGQATRAGFFFRPAGGTMRTDASYREFETGSSLAGTGTNGEAATTSEEVEEPPRPPDAMLSPAVRRMPGGHLMAWLIVGGIAAIVAGLGGFFWGRSNTVKAHMPQLSLRLLRTDGRLSAMWDGSAPPVVQARSGRLEVWDGAASSRVPLNPTMLRRGAWPVPSESAEVSVRLVIEVANADPVWEVAKFLGPEQPASDALAGAPSLTPEQERQAVALRGEIETDRALLNETTRNNDDLEEKINALRKQVNAKLSPPKPSAEPAAADVPRPPRASSPAVSAPVVSSPAAAQPAATQPAPTPPPAPATDSAAAAPLFGERPTPAVKPVQLPPPVELPRPAYSGPSAGKTIWTGSLGAGATLTLEGRRASAGSLNSALPAAPLRVNIFPAEFSSGGLSVFSGLPRHAGGNVKEPRSAQNGWLETRYVWDAERARGVSLVEAPSPANGHKLTVRAGERPVSVIVIDWQIAQ